MGEGEMEYGQTVILRTAKKPRERREGRDTTRVYLRSIDLYEARGAASARIDGIFETRGKMDCYYDESDRRPGKVVASN